jgi:hypothetical protein
MTKLSNVERLIETAVDLVMPEEKVEHEAETRFMTSIFIDGVVVTRHPKKIKIWNVEKLPKIELISTIDIEWSGHYIKKCDNSLYVGNDQKITVFDLSDLKNPIEVREITVPKYEYFYVADNLIYIMIERDIYVINGGGTLEKIIALPQDNEMMFDYPVDMCKFENRLYFVFRHCGLYLYEQLNENGAYEFVSKHQPATGYTPTDMKWLDQGKELLLIGNDNVVQYNVTNNKKFKRFKAAKLKKTEIYGDVAFHENELIVVGTKGTKDKFVIGVLEPTEKGVVVVNTPKVDYKIRVKRGNTEWGEDACGVMVHQDYLIIVGKESGFFLFKADC